MNNQHIPAGAHSLNAYITVNNCRAAIDFYKKVFDAIENFTLTMPDGSIGHAEISIEGSLLMLSEENLDWGNLSPQTVGGNPVLLALYVADVDAVYQRAIDAGCTSKMEVKDEFYGDRCGQILDPFGYKWMLATHKEVVSPEEMQARMDKMFVQG